MRRNGNLRDMRKRRVGVTARSREIVGNQATGTPQIATEIAAPHVSRTPMSTVAAATTECGWKHGDTGAKDNRTDNGSGDIAIAEPGKNGTGRSGERAKAARMRRCLKLRQGASPLRPPAPFPSVLIVRKGGTLSRVRCASPNQAALDRVPPFPRNTACHEGKGAHGLGALPRLPLVGPRGDFKSRK